MASDSADLPEGWAEVSLGDIAEVRSGGTPSTRLREYWGGQIPWFGTGSINHNVISQFPERITEAGLAASSAQVFPAGTLVMAMIGQGATRGKVALLGQASAFNQNCVAIVPKGDASSEYLFHFFEFHYNQVRRLGNAGSVTNLNAHLVRSLRVLLPRPAQQRAIARCLQTWDRAGVLTSHLRCQKEVQKGALAQQLLTGKSRVGSFTTGWVTRRLGYFFSPKAELNVGNADVMVLSCTKDKGLVAQADRFAKRLAALDTSRYKMVGSGDFVMDPMLLWDGSHGFLDRYESGVVSPAYETFSFHGDRSLQALFSALFRTHLFRHIFRAISQGTNVRRRSVPVESFLSIQVDLPSQRAEQAAIVEVLAAADREIELLGKLLDAYKRQKRGLMQKLLTGQIRVKV